MDVVINESPTTIKALIDFLITFRSKNNAVRPIYLKIKDFIIAAAPAATSGKG